ncbi:MAG: hypothetical protein HY912_23235 [Desulfomonile tiedjei]|uniref:Uncharacterized protein n=1 Tax=Desulfomonile tiedjei TaxID=2358 RepID=A0A9D6Z5R7_9BACT|nr:hypothetical protein [Desulfomonile tiedjei]
MEAMLTSFGIDQAIAKPVEAPSMFHFMPPVSFRQWNQYFMPDFNVLLLCDTVMMDESSFSRLVERPAPAYATVSQAFRDLRADGRIQFVDFQQILRNNKALHQRMMENDIRILDQWVSPLRDSLTIWRNFSRQTIELVANAYQGDTGLPSLHSSAKLRPRHWQNVEAVIMDKLGTFIHDEHVAAQHIGALIEEALLSSAKRRKKEYRSALREVLTDYLSYVNANLIIADELQVSFHDWQDFLPFYNLKFLSVGHDGIDIEKKRSQLEKFFTVAFPDLALRSPYALLTALNDKRIEELRRLIDEAAAGKVTFDQEFAKSVLAEVFRSERRTQKWRKVVGYATMPIGFVPWIGTPAQKLMEEAIGTPIERKLKKKHRWLYMLSDIAES